MGRRPTVTLLAIALLMLVLAPKMASADEITTNAGMVIIPNGSHVTSVFLAPTFDICFNVIGVDFAFQGGTGSTISCLGVGGSHTTIDFTVPVTNLSLTALVSGDRG